MMIETSLQCEILESYVDNIPAYVYVNDLQGNYTYMNTAFERLHQINRSDLKKRNYNAYDLFSKEDAEKIMEMDRRVIETGERLEIKHTLHKGMNDTGNKKSDESSCQQYWYWTLKFPLRNALGDIIGSCGFSHDITESSQQESRMHENALQKSENRFRSLCQHIQNAFALHEIVSDDEGNPVDYVFLEVNEYFEEMTGLKAVDIIGRRASEVFPTVDMEQIQRYGKVALEGSVERFEQYSDPLEKWYMGLAFRPQKNEFVTLFIDITDRMQIEEALRQSEERHRTLFESMMQGVVYQDTTGNIIAANPSAERILGLTVDQMMGRCSVDPRWKAVREDGSDYPGESHPSMVALRTGKPVTGAIMGVYHPADNSQHWINIDAVPLFKPNETRPFQLYTTFTDISEHKKVERAMRRAKEKAEEGDKLKSAFLANMSHEIRTPLNGIMGHIDLALSNNLSESCRQENQEGLEVARESGYLLVSIINDILDLSKIEAGQMAIGIHPFSLLRMVDQVMRVGKMLLKTRRKETIQLTRHIDTNISNCVFGDDYRIQQVVNNLLSNAVKFTENGSVDLIIRLLPGKMLEFIVKDTGRGISEDQLEVIFQAFRQADFSDTRKFGGTGLGLTISRKLVELMGGKLWVESTVNVGSAFHFTLPYERAPDESIQDTDGPPELIATPSIASGKILIAEDDPVSRKVVTKMVEKAGYDVLLAENGEIAVAKFESDRNIDLILMDVNMDVMGGLEATARIREMEARNHRERRTPIIGLSAAAMNGDRERGTASGMTDYLTKPVNRKSLIETIEQYLGRLEIGSNCKQNADKYCPEKRQEG